MMKETYLKMQERIQPDAALITAAVESAAKPKRRPILKYTGIAAAAACLVMVGSVPVLAANVPAFYHVLYKISPQTAELFKPVEMTCESNGIRMEVGAIYFRENTVEVYVTMQDLEADRLNMGENIVSSFRLMVPSLSEYSQSSIASCNYTGYDTEHKTLTMLLEIEVLHGELTPGDEVIFSLDHVYGEEIHWEGELDMVDLQSAVANAEFCENEELQVYALFENPEWEAYREKTQFIMLKPSAKTPTPAESVAFTGAGYRDGLLHMQMHFEELDDLNTGTVSLLKADGTRIEPLAGMYGCEDKSKIHDLTSQYTDYLFDISEEELLDCRLYGDFRKHSDNVAGDWTVTFTLPERTE